MCSAHYACRNPREGVKSSPIHAILTSPPSRSVINPECTFAVSRRLNSIVSVAAHSGRTLAKGSILVPIRDFQLSTHNALLANRSTIVVAPTGLGKTRASTEPFVNAGSVENGMGGRLLYVLPIRALTQGVRDEIDELARLSSRSWRSVVHHGVEPESQVFAEMACVTTVDQYFTAFAGAPLSFAASTGHAVAGAILTSYSIFDEAHLLAPQRGLPLLFAILKQRQRWGLLSTVMTATLPTTVVAYIHDNLGFEVIEPSDRDIQARDGWRKLTLRYHEQPEAPDLVAEVVRGFQQRGRVIVFANTVKRAIDYCGKLRGILGAERVSLAHSRFIAADRQARENDLRDRFGRDSDFEGVLVTTQVAEAGLNISAPLVISELCPADSLVQRAGRCIRFTEDNREQRGELWVLQSASDRPHLPYNEELVDSTQAALKHLDGATLDWPTEKNLVEQALSEHYDFYLRAGHGPAKKTGKMQAKKPQPKPEGLTLEQAFGVYERAFRRRAPDEVEKVLRDMVNVQIMVSDDLAATRQRFEAGVEWPAMVNLAYGSFRGEAQRLQVYPILQERGMQSHTVGRQPTHVFLPGRAYVLLASEAGYSHDLGLTFAGDGTATPWESLPEAEQREKRQGHLQTYEAHAQGVAARAEHIAAIYRPFIARWAQGVFGTPPETTPLEIADSLVQAMKTSAMFHDVGKLALAWQTAVGWHPGESLVARTLNRRIAPPHAVYAYPFLSTLLEQVWGERRLGAMLALATARHHALGVSGAVKAGEFVPASGAEEVLTNLAAQWTDASVAAAVPHALNAASQPTKADEPPGPSNDFYLLYCLTHRLVKLADWEDASNEAIEMKGWRE